MRARFYDGLTARPHDVDITVSGQEIAFEVDGARHAWARDRTQVDQIGEMVRLSLPDDPARLQVAAGDWLAESGAPAAGAAKPLLSRGEVRLVGGLVLAASAVLAFVFVGMPAASGPLARATPPNLESQIGRNFESQVGLAFKPCEGQAGQQALAALGRKLGDASESPFPIRVRAVRAPFANAFALPGGTVLVTGELIEMAQTPDELAAVVAHEVAHVEKRHVMQAVWRSLGLGIVLDAVVGGGTGAGQQAVLLAGSVTDLRYSRAAESEADVRGMELLHARGLSSKGMAPFFERLASKGESADAAAVKELISSHPDSRRRAKESRARAKAGAPALTPTDWAAVRAACPEDKRSVREKLSEVLSKDR